MTGGYDSRDRIIDLVSTKGGVARETVAAEVDKKLAEHMTAQASWSGRTDADKVEAAFAALEKEGILARPHLGWGQGEASTLIEEEVKKARAAGKKVKGWVFFTEQETKSAVRDGMLHLFAGGPMPVEQWDRIIAIVEARMKATGLKVDWPYSNSAYPVIVENIDWKKRR